MGTNALVYAKGGYTNVLVKGSYFDGTTTFRDSDTINGYRVGAGVEVGSGNFRFRGEYRYSDYGKYGTGLGFGIKAKRSQFVAAIVSDF